jgi:hypothetical protein
MAARIHFSFSVEHEVARSRIPLPFVTCRCPHALQCNLRHGPAQRIKARNLELRYLVSQLIVSQRPECCARNPSRSCCLVKPCPLCHSQTRLELHQHLQPPRTTSTAMGRKDKKQQQKEEEKPAANAKAGKKEEAPKEDKKQKGGKKGKK